MNGFLLDENLPHHLIFAPSLPVVASSVLGLRPSDTQLRDQSLVIVTKDADFSDRIMIAASSPWIVHLRFGNLRRKEYHSLLAKMWPRVELLLPAHKLICVYHDRIEAFRD